MTSVVDAVKNNRTQILSLLVAIKGSVPDRELNTALQEAIKTGSTECAKILLQAGADPDGSALPGLAFAAQHGRLEILKLLLAQPECDVNEKTGRRGTALHLAVLAGSQDCVAELLVADAHPDSQDDAGNTPLILCCRDGKSQTMHAIAKLLLKYGCDINAVNSDGRCGLHYTVETLRGVDLLVKSGADVNIRDRDGNTPLILAASEGLCTIIKCLVSGHCDVNVANDDNKTALHLLAMKGHVCCMKELIMRGADLNVRDMSGVSPLHEAINRGRKSAAKYLIQRNCHLDVPAMKALEEGYPEILKMLLLARSDPRQVTDAMTHPGQYFIFSDYPDIYDWLVEVLFNPFPLKELCRLRIRHILGDTLCQDMETLRMPRFLQDWCLMSELDDYD